MGAAWFATYSNHPDAETAFRVAVEADAEDYGRGGYTGTIAEKTTFVVIEVEAGMVGIESAYAIADHLCESEDPRVNDTWGPAGAIAVKLHPSNTQPGEPDGWMFVGWAAE